MLRTSLSVGGEADLPADAHEMAAETGMLAADQRRPLPSTDTHPKAAKAITILYQPGSCQWDGKKLKQQMGEKLGKSCSHTFPQSPV